MLVTTVPSMVITLILFTVAGLLYDTSGSQDIETFTRALDGRFNITPWLLLVPVLTGVLIARRTPPVITLFLSALIAKALRPSNRWLRDWCFRKVCSATSTRRCLRHR